MTDHRAQQSNPQDSPTPPVAPPADGALEDLAPRLTPEQEDKLRGGLAPGREPGVQAN